MNVDLALNERDARFCVEHLRYLADLQEPTTAYHAAAYLSALWLALKIESALGGAA